MDAKVKNVKFNLIDSINAKYVEVVATYQYKGELKHKYIFLDRAKNKTKADYLKEAKEKFNADEEKSHKKSPLLLALSCTLAATTVAFAGLFTYKMLTPVTPGGGGGEVISGEITFDDESSDVKIEPTSAPKNKEYVGTITVKSQSHAIPLNEFEVTVGDKVLTADVDYEIKLDGTDSSGNYKYKIKINANCVTGEKITIHAPSEDLDKFMIHNQEEYESMFNYNCDLKTTMDVPRDYSSNYHEIFTNMYTDKLVYQNLNDLGLSEYETEFFSRDEVGADTYYNYYNRGELKMYERELKEEQVDGFPTVQDDAALNEGMSTLLGTAPEFEVFGTLDPTTLSYAYEIVDPDSGMKLKIVFMAYEQQVTSLYFYIVDGDTYNLFSGFEYTTNFEIPALPSDSETFDYELYDSPGKLENDNDLKKMLTLPKEPNLRMNYNYPGKQPGEKDINHTCSYLKDKYRDEYESDSMSNEDTMGTFYSKENSDYFKYTEDADSMKWLKNPSDKDEYDKYSYEKLCADFETIASYSFTFEPEEETNEGLPRGKYVYTDEVNEIEYSVECYSVTALDEATKEQALKSVEVRPTNPTEEKPVFIYNKFSNFDIHFELPPVD